MGKRAIDVAFAIVGLILVWPLMLAVGLVVKLESHGPALFRQERVGLNGKHFRINKFRTMRVGGSGPFVTTATDSRVTRVGRVLRATKLDELPQFWNVLVGHMSIVGPRPEVPRHVARWPEHSRRLILSVRPGITCLASVQFRDEGSLIPADADIEDYYFRVLMPAKNALSEAYVVRRSLGMDARILLQTVQAVTFGRWSRHVLNEVGSPAQTSSALSATAPVVEKLPVRPENARHTNTAAATSGAA